MSLLIYSVMCLIVKKKHTVISSVALFLLIKCNPQKQFMNLV